MFFYLHKKPFKVYKYSMLQVTVEKKIWREMKKNVLVGNLRWNVYISTNGWCVPSTHFPFSFLLTLKFKASLPKDLP